MGKSRTLYKIKEKYMWHGLVKDVVEMIFLFKMLACTDQYQFLQIASCDICQCINKKLSTGVLELNPVPVKRLWHQ